MKILNEPRCVVGFGVFVRVYTHTPCAHKDQDLGLMVLWLGLLLLLFIVGEVRVARCGPPATSSTLNLFDVDRSGSSCSSRA